MPTNRAEWTHPDLQSLVDLFFPDPATLGVFSEVPPEQLPPPWLHLLAHTHHMTVTVETFYDSPVHVEVLEKQVTKTHYARKILLRRVSDSRVVQFGIVRLGRASLPDDVMEQIESERVPLGRILIDHKVLRNVKLMSLWQIDAGPALREAFQNPELHQCFGRTALIYANGLPAVELLEIVA
jgi:chorismate-pyruvate lyase